MYLFLMSLTSDIHFSDAVRQQLKMTLGICCNHQEYNIMSGRASMCSKEVGHSLLFVILPSAFKCNAKDVFYEFIDILYVTALNRFPCYGASGDTPPSYPGKAYHIWRSKWKHWYV